MGAAWRKLAAWWRDLPPTAETSWMARQVKANSTEIATLRASVATLEAELARQGKQRASGIESVRLALDAAGVPVPDCLAAEAPTQPIYLRAV